VVKDSIWNVFQHKAKVYLGLILGLFFRPVKKLSQADNISVPQHAHDLQLAILELAILVHYFYRYILIACKIASIIYGAKGPIPNNAEVGVCHSARGTCF
jgi:hypothetical protein